MNDDLPAAPPIEIVVGPSYYQPCTDGVEHRDHPEIDPEIGWTTSTELPDGW